MDEVTSSTNECPAGETIKENNLSDLPVEKHQIPSKSTEKENDEISKCKFWTNFCTILLSNY